MPLDATATPHAMTEDGVQDCDVLVIGGGPAGSTTAALLAERGRRVVLLEKDAHPRFHIGESLLPHNLRQFERLGILDQVRALGIHKPGASFVSDEHGKHVSFDFGAGLNKDYTYAYHVKRAEFDELLFRTATERGAEAHERMRVTTVEIDPANGSRVTARDAAGAEQRYRARFVVDASGRDTFLAGQMRTKERNPHNNTAAIFGHFRNVATHEGCDERHIVIHLLDHGWCWMIPLTGGVMSIGIVSSPEFFKRRTGSFEEFLLRSLNESPSVAARIAGAELVSPVTTTGNYSYRASSMAGDGWLLAGDAFAFVDPIFSSGVLLAMASGEMAADVVDTWLDDRAAAARKMRAFEAKVRRAVASLSWLIYRINRPVLRDMLLEPRNKFRMREGLVSLLAGDVHANTNRQLPVLAFKASYYFLSAAHRLGFRLRATGMVRVPRGAPAPLPAE